MSDTGRPRTLKRQGSVSVDAAYAMPAPLAHRIRRQGVVGPVGLGGHDAGRRGGAADSGERASGGRAGRSALVYTPVPLGSFPLVLPHIPPYRRIHDTKHITFSCARRILRRDGRSAAGSRDGPSRSAPTLWEAGQAGALAQVAEVPFARYRLVGLAQFALVLARGERVRPFDFAVEFPTADRAYDVAERDALRRTNARPVRRREVAEHRERSPRVRSRGRETRLRATASQIKREAPAGRDGRRHRERFDAAPAFEDGRWRLEPYARDIRVSE